MSKQIDFQGVTNALSELISGDARFAAAEGEAEAARANADAALHNSRTQAESEYNKIVARADADFKNQIGAANGQAARLSGEAVHGLVEYASRAGIPMNAAWAGGNPRQIGELQAQFDSLRQRGETLQVLNEIEEAKRQAPKPIMRWLWLGVTGIGLLAILL